MIFYSFTLAVVSTITQGPMSISGLVGENMMFTCMAIGIPLPVITWMDEGSNNVRTIVINGGTVVQSTLTLSNLQDEDFDHYTCTATNIFGNDSATALLGSEFVNDVNGIDV